MTDGTNGTFKDVRPRLFRFRELNEARDPASDICDRRASRCPPIPYEEGQRRVLAKLCETRKQKPPELYSKL